MEQISTKYRGFTIYARAVGPLSGPWEGAYSVYEPGPENTWPGALEGTLEKTFKSVPEAQNAAAVKCRRQLDYLLAQALRIQQSGVNIISRRQNQRAAWEHKTVNRRSA